MVQNKIIAHLCGGCGVSLGDKILKHVGELGKTGGFANWEFNFIDTSKNNYDNIDKNLGELFLIQPKAYDNQEISGSGSDRIRNAADIQLNIPDYLKKYNLKKAETGVYHLVAFSATGGKQHIAA